MEKGQKKPKPVLASLLLAGSVILAGAADARAQQSGTGTLTGTVVDNVGVVPGATITVTQPASGTVRTMPTSEEGLFRLAALPPGRYTLRVEMSGFKPVTMTEIQLSGGEIRDVGRIVLEVGSLEEAIQVTAEVTPVQVATSSRRGTVTSDDLTNIQMKGRDVYGLLAILPGVMDTNLNRDFTTWTSMRDVTINGAPQTSKNVMLDGISVVDEGGSGNAFVNPNIDAVGEVQVIANGYTAENGRNNGGLINMVTKSGTSQFKGSGWYNARRDQWNAIDYIRKRQGQAKPLYRVNIAGYSIGGPVIIPKVLDSRTSSKKVFFFFSQEYTDDARPTQTQRFNLPTALERNGDFSQTRVTNGNLQAIVDPLTGQPFPGNVIPASRIHPMGQALLNLLPLPNNILNPIAGQEWTSNHAFDRTPEHSRTNHVFRTDVVLGDRWRASTKLLADREDNWTDGTFGAGLGRTNNFVPGWVLSGTLTTVLSPTMVNEITAGFGHNNYGFRGDYDYTQYYRQNMGIDPPRLEPFGPYQDPPAITYRQTDEYPYIPVTSYGGGSRSGLASYSPGAVNNRVMPTANRNDRYSFQNDLSITRGRHNFKFGVYVELNSKTEPGSSNYMGNYNFGHNTTNPLSTGNGYANALLGVFTTYTEVSNRVDKDLRHWQNEGYLQDSWRIHPRLTLDYGVRLTHSGAYYEINNANAGFYPELWDPALAPRLYRPHCLVSRAGNQSCPTASRRAIDPVTGQIESFAFVGNVVPGSGDFLNGMRAGGRTGKGDYVRYPFLVAAPRIGFAWDVTGDGKTALRASYGIFYNFPRSGPGSNSFIGDPPTSFNRIVRNARFEDIANFATAGIAFAESPISSSVATLDGTKYPLERSYNVNVAFQRDIGFNTVVEAAYVGNFTRGAPRTQDLNSIPLYAYGDVNNLFNNQAISANFLRSRWPGMGAMTEYFFDLDTLTYHSLQLNAQRRLTQGLQMGVAYTLARGMGEQGYDEYTDALGGEAALRERYYGPTSVDRTHNLVVNYSYEIPSVMPDNRIVNAILGDWQVSGVTKFLSGTVVNPSCSSNNSGIANSDPTLTGIADRCMLTGAPLFSGYEIDPDPLVARHFNPAAFAMAQPLSPTVGNFGNAPLGLLRNPSWSNWDVTLARRFPLPMINPGAQMRVQIQAYNIFNQVEFTTMNATLQFTGANNSVLNSANTGRYTAVIPPRQIGLTFRLDF
jgi:hypothetical protein